MNIKVEVCKIVNNALRKDVYLLKCNSPLYSILSRALQAKIVIPSATHLNI
jgi:hypothetical protein